jgi:hypothetical protein
MPAPPRELQPYVGLTQAEGLLLHFAALSADPPSIRLHPVSRSVRACGARKFLFIDLYGI